MMNFTRIVIFCLTANSIWGMDAEKVGSIIVNDTSKYWEVNPSDFEFSMTLIGMVSSSGINETLETYEIGAFHNDELRGSARAFYISQNDNYIFFLTIFGNKVGDTIGFMLYDHRTESMYEVDNMMEFRPDTHKGEILSPVAFSTLTSSVLEVDNDKLVIYPNPTADGIRFESPHKINSIFIYNTSGQIVKSLKRESTERQWEYIDVSDLEKGHYIVVGLGKTLKTVGVFLKS